ncbi:MAG TPA: hypothetical protein DCY13_03860, partial [Verrucomicrobiales bacterium]|nr:hypothetical protein [Verrucomicrobiales bacterium]
MKPDQPRDPREQLEVRITALLLGEASAFEEAELLETIKNDPELEAYYDEMRAMVKLVEESAQTAPMAGTAEAAKQPRLADDRRAALQKLFNQPAIGAIPVERSSATVVWLRGTGMALARQVLPIAAALVILLIAVGLFLPAGSKAKSKATRMARFVSDFEEPSGRVLSENALGEQVDQAAIRPNADVKSSRSSGRVEPA